jgi:ribosome-associated translation inhibitor RaiA
MEVEVHAAPEVPPAEVEAARRGIAALERYTDEPILSARLTLRRGGGSQTRPVWVADAVVVWNGRPVKAHTTGPSPSQAAEEAAERLRRQVRRVVGADVALRDEEEIRRDLRHRPGPSGKPPELRDIVQRRTYMPVPESTFDAVTDLLDLDLEFYLFTHAQTGEDVVVHRRDDGRIGLLHPQGSPLAADDDLVVPEPSRYPAPIPLEQARSEMDVLDHRFLYFVDSADGRGKVIYLRHDGDYGLVEPAT